MFRIHATIAAAACLVGRMIWLPIVGESARAATGLERENLLTLQAGGSPCMLMAMFGGQVSCETCLAECTFCFIRAGPIAKAMNVGTAGCRSAWCSHVCLERYLESMAPCNFLKYEMLCHHDEVRDFVSRAQVESSLPEELLIEVEPWVRGSARPGKWIGGAKPMQDCSILNALKPWPAWLEEMVIRCRATFLHELQAAALLLHSLPQEMRADVFAMLRGYSIEQWCERFEDVVKVAHRFRIFGTHRGDEVHLLLKFGRCTRRREDYSDWRTDSMSRLRPRAVKISPIDGGRGSRADVFNAVVVQRAEQLVASSFDPSEMGESAESVEGQLLGMLANGASTSRQLYKATVCDEGLHSEDRQGYLFQLRSRRDRTGHHAGASKSSEFLNLQVGACEKAWS